MMWRRWEIAWNRRLMGSCEVLRGGLTDRPKSGSHVEMEYEEEEKDPELEEN